MTPSLLGGEQAFPSCNALCCDGGVFGCAQEQYARFFVREMTEPRNESFLSVLARTLWWLLRQKRLKGHWVTITPSQKHILPRFGIFFEDYTGDLPPSPSSSPSPLLTV